MSHTIQRTEHVPKSDAKIIPFVVRNKSGSRVDLTGAMISWELRKRPSYDPALSLQDAGVRIVNRVDGQGEFAIRLDTDATAGLEATTYRERVRLVDSSGDQTTFIGEVPIVEDS